MPLYTLTKIYFITSIYYISYYVQLFINLKVKRNTQRRTQHEDVRRTNYNTHAHPRNLHMQ
jgi:predicted secreted protein